MTLETVWTNAKFNTKYKFCKYNLGMKEPTKTALTQWEKLNIEMKKRITNYMNINLAVINLYFLPD